MDDAGIFVDFVKKIEVPINIKAFDKTDWWNLLIREHIL